MLTDKTLQNLEVREKAYKVADRDGLYAWVSPAGSITWRYDYRFNARRETLTIGRYGKKGEGYTLAEARERLADAKRLLRDGISPAREKADGKGKSREALTFTAHAEKWLADSSTAESTKAMRRSLLNRDILPTLGKRLLEEIKPSELLALCDRIKARGAPAPAVQAREIVSLVYRHAQGRGLTVENPAENIRPSAIATFKPRERAASPAEIGVLFRALDRTATLPTLRLAVRFLLLTMVRKGEFINATWDEVDFDNATWTIPAERMKARRAHTVYLSQQALDILTALKVCAGDSPYLHASRYRSDEPISNATLNRVIDAAIAQARKEGGELDDLSVHDLRRTASTLLHEAGFTSDWIEKCLAHEQKGVRAVYNRAEYGEQRREMLQQWANMVDGWVKGTGVVPLRVAA